MVTITEVKIKGFRGFTKEQGFDFSSPVTILFGENGKGKSSLLNAIEWCLFGNECIGKNTGIRERIDWEVKNRNTNECYVQVIMKENEKEYAVKRIWKSITKDQLQIIMPDGKIVDGEEARKELVKLTKNFSFKDFLSSIYQHQEVIRFFLIQEPKYRNDAIDRLLGLSEYRNMIDGIYEAKIKEDILQNEIDKISEQIKAKIYVWQTQIREKTEELKSKGITEGTISENGARDLAEDIKNSLFDFSQKIGVGLSGGFSTVDASDLGKFIDLAKEEITRFRSEMPDQEKELEIYKELSEIEKDLISYGNAQKEFNEKDKDLQEFIRKNGKIEELENKKTDNEREIKERENEKERINLLGATVEKAIKYLKLETVENKNVCPVCRTEIKGLLEQLEKEYEEKYKKQLEEINKELETKRDELKKIEGLISEYEKKEENRIRSEEEFKKVSESIKNKYGISEREDVEKWLDNFKMKKEEELEEIKKRVEEKQKELNKIEENIDILSKVYEVLRYKIQMEKARDIERSDEWKRLQDKADEFKKLVEEIKEIVSAIKKASQEEASDKIESARKKISEYFKTITKHPMISEVKFEVSEDPRTGGNSYEFKDQNRKDIIPILSQGNLNALALSIFLALAETQDAPFNFLIFDDPSQSLGESEKEEFIKILNEIAQQKNLIISTMDNEFYKILQDITKRRKIYHFRNWTPDKGPEIEIITK